MTSSSASKGYILIGIIFIIIAISLQVHFKSPIKLKPLDPITTASLYNPENNAVDGNPNGAITLVVFFDYNCKYCRALHLKLKMLATKNPELRIVYKEFPILGQTSLPPTAAALAAHKQGKYLLLQDALLTATHPLNQVEILKIAQQMELDAKQLQTDMASAEIQAQIQKNTLLAEKLGITGVPAIVVGSSQLAKDPTQTHLPQYIYRGSDTKDLQRLIDKIKQ